jgi:hypothetical protein
MMIKFSVFIPLFLFVSYMSGQEVHDAWMKSQLDEVIWQESYKGVLADYHPVTLILASDQHQVAGYLIHEGDQRKHKLLGDKSKTGHFQLQELDAYDRLTGYLTGSITNDQVIMKWMSADQSRLFEVKAFPERLIKIKNFKPTAEWIDITGATPLSLQLSVQKMDYGIVSGIANLDGQFSRFEGDCLDGTCSIWNTLIPDAQGAPIHIQMRQKDQNVYKAMLNGKEYKGEIKYSTPLAVRLYDNSSGFLDFVYPKFQSKGFDQWLSQKIDSIWDKGIHQLSLSTQPEDTERLSYRSSGWIEIVDEGASYVSGIITFINPDMVHSESFVWLKKEDEFLTQGELVNAQEDLHKGSALALAAATSHDDPEYHAWLEEVGYDLIVPTFQGVAMTTEFNMVYGDELRLLNLEESKAMIKRKYWKYFGW